VGRTGVTDRSFGLMNLILMVLPQEGLAGTPGLSSAAQSRASPAP
jgi:hypothetical protein